MADGARKSVESVLLMPVHIDCQRIIHLLIKHDIGADTFFHYWDTRGDKRYIDYARRRAAFGQPPHRRMVLFPSTDPPRHVSP